MWRRGSKICGRHVLGVDICWFVAFLFLMVLLRPQGSIHKVVPLGNGARARIDVLHVWRIVWVSREDEGHSQGRDRGGGSVESGEGGGWWMVEVEREEVFWIVLSVQEGSVVWTCCLVSILYSCMWVYHGCVKGSKRLLENVSAINDHGNAAVLLANMRKMAGSGTNRAHTHGGPWTT